MRRRCTWLSAPSTGASVDGHAIALPATDGRRATLYYGARTPNVMAYTDKFDTWKGMGVDVVPVISQPRGFDWKGEVGYVQDAAGRKGIASAGEVGVILCGQKEMAGAVKELCVGAGVAEERILTNF